MPYNTLEVIGPEHEFALINNELTPLPISDKILKVLYGRVAKRSDLNRRERIVNEVKFNGFTWGKELQMHVLELKANEPFFSPKIFEKVMFNGVCFLEEYLEKFNACLLGSGMHPTLKLNQTKIWNHRDKRIYDAFKNLFNMNQHGWLNIQSYQVNLPYSKEKDCVKLHNIIANILPYLPAISASSPIFESRLGEFVDNRLYFYGINQKEIPSITGDIIPEYINSFKDYQNNVIGKYCKDLQEVGAPEFIRREWLNSRGAIIRFERKAIEIRIFDEQECIKTDVAIGCFIQALLRGLFNNNFEILLPHSLLIKDMIQVITKGLDAKVQYPTCKNAREVCSLFYKIALENANYEEKRYLGLIKDRIKNGNLSTRILRDLKKEASKTDFKNAIIKIYSNLSKCLLKNTSYK